MVGAALLQAAAFGYLAYTSVWLQSLLCDGPVRAGLITLALAAASFVTAALTGRVLHDRPARLPVCLGMVLLGVGDLLQARLTGGSTGLSLLPGLAVAGIGAGLALPTSASAVMAAVHRRDAGMASGALNTFRQLGLALGIAVFGVVFRAGLADGLGASVPDPHGVAGALAGGQAHAILARVPAGHRAAAARGLHEAFAHGLNATLLAAGLTAFLGAALVLVLVRRAGPAADARPADGRQAPAPGRAPARPHA